MQPPIIKEIARLHTLAPPARSGAHQTQGLPLNLPIMTIITPLPTFYLPSCPESNVCGVVFGGKEKGLQVIGSTS
jgi:hypothetical protein